MCVRVDVRGADAVALLCVRCLCDCSMTEHQQVAVMQHQAVRQQAASINTKSSKQQQQVTAAQQGMRKMSSELLQRYGWLIQRGSNCLLQPVACV